MRKRLLGFVVLLAALAGAQSARGGDLRLEGFSPAEFGSDSEVKPDGTMDPETLPVLTDPGVTLYLAPGLRFVARGKLAPAAIPVTREQDPTPGRMVDLDTMEMSYEKGWLSIRGGKLTPTFDFVDSPVGDGIEFAEDHRLGERVAVESAADFDYGDWGEQSLTASTFFVDTSPLAADPFDDTAAAPTLEDGGLGNTGSFSSFAVALAADRIRHFGDIGYHLGYAHQAAGRTGSAAEDGVVAALHHRGVELVPDLTFAPVVEAAAFRNAGGEAGKLQHYITLSGQLDWRNWNLAASVGREQIETAEIAGMPDDLLGLSTGYEFDFGLTADFDWRRTTTVEGLPAHTFGLLFGYSRKF